MSLDKNLNKILIIDFGSQFTQLIARRIRESGVYSEIISHKKVKNKNINNSIKGIILSGGPLNVYQIKGEGKNLFESINGDEDTIMGLPIKKIREYLEIYDN